jgi:hypothetical protein
MSDSEEIEEEYQSDTVASASGPKNGLDNIKLKKIVNHELALKPPKFTVSGNNADDSDDGSDSNIELWTFRMEQGFPLQKLDGVKFNLKELQSTGDTVRITTKNQKNKDDEDDKEEEGYTMTVGETFENETFRVLEPLSSINRKTNQSSSSDSSDSDSDSSSDSSDKKKRNQKKKDKQPHMDDDDTMKKLLCPSSKPFTRHFNVLKAFTHMSETQMAPLQGPEPTDPVRHAYAPIPQRKGLKRRWMPLGVKTTNPTKSKRIDEGKKQKSSGKREHQKTNDDGAGVASPATKRIKTHVSGDNGHRHHHHTSDTHSKEEDNEISLSKEERRASKEKRKAEKKAKKEKKSKKEGKKTRTKDE